MGSVATCKQQYCCGNRLNCTGPEDPPPPAPELCNTITAWKVPDMATYYADVRIYSGQDYWSATISLEAQGFSNASRSMEVWQSAVQAASVFDVTVERISTTKTRGTDPIPILAPNLLKDIFTKLDVRKR